MALLSIIVPVYNAEKYLARCIESIQRNTFAEWELILVDDGSTDAGGHVCDRYSEVDDRIVVLHQPNQGQSEARNNGLRIAKGRYVTFVDADDEISEDAYLPNVQYLETHPEVDLLQYPTLWNCNTPEARKDQLPATTISGETLIFKAFCDNAPINYSVWNKLFRREVVQDAKFVTGRLYEDKLFLLDVIQRTKSIYISVSGEYHYYQYPASSINKATFLRRISWVESEYILLQAMYRFPETSHQWVRRWMETNRYLAVTHSQFPAGNIKAQKEMMKQSTPSATMVLNKDGVWFGIIKLLGTSFFLWFYTLLLNIRKPVKASL